MHIVNIGYNHSHHADFHIHRPQGSGDYLLLLLKSSAVFTLHGDDYTAEKDSFILFNEHTPQFYRAEGGPFSNDWFHFELQPQDLPWFHRLSIPMDQVVPLGDLNELSMFINHMCYERYAAGSRQPETVELYMKLFFIKLSQRLHQHSNETPSSHYNKLSIVRTKIFNQPSHPWTIDDLCGELTMSRSNFQHLYKELFGVSPMSDVILSRIEHAKYLLSTTDITVKKIAEMCGYNNEIHFMRQFKKHLQQTPSAFRENCR
ncbi:helix-turn-helix transcriptional regulator [Paenibacillus lemnae]|uniref:Helix-turn-helix transcriptional regulator n=1 Tax=Paenibacillus lemnae TaxID=1330551 RepID=A0A848M4I9_PAELE|nr:AraC family transcriptional regulator [Paenibacillus lemnae]NMO95140.1 helix-turn-helix transcriptional regulator [Paenibacillus lemnae]